MKGLAILQARTSSSRLPAKVLLPMGGMPMAVLAARRAANTGREVIVATSREVSDDLLGRTLAAHGQASFRGSLDDPLQRLVDALQCQDDERIVFRLTGDNVFPDGALLDAMEEDFQRRGLDYLACNGVPSGVPYGVSVEVMRVKHLRQALVSSEHGHDREHVTPWIVRRYGAASFDRYAHLGMGLHRSTVDTLSDYLRIASLFQEGEDGSALPMLELVQRLARLPDAPVVKRPAKKLVVGTAQFGLDYGIANISGRPAQETCQAILAKAVANGVEWIDSARAYGESEAVLGRALQAQELASRSNLVTKLSPLADCPPDAPSVVVAAFVDASVHASLHALRVSVLPALLMHRSSHLGDWNGAAWRRLCELKGEGRIQRLGVSVQSLQELKVALQEGEVSFVQLPLNLLDWRWDEVPALLRAARQNRQVVVHARSAFLQGLLLSRSFDHWKQANCAEPGPVLSWLSEQAAAAGRSGVADLALAWVRSQDWIDGIVVGMESLIQLDDNLRYFDTPLLDAAAMQAIAASRPRLPEQVLNPALWNPRK